MTSQPALNNQHSFLRKHLVCQVTSTLWQLLARALKCRCEKLLHFLSLDSPEPYETKGHSAMGFSGFCCSATNSAEFSQVKAALVKSIEKPIEGTYEETKRSTSSCMELSQSLHHRTHWSLSPWCQASHQPGQVQRPMRACGKPSRIVQMTATCHCSKKLT